MGRHMYKLRILIDSDGDFYYENPLFKPDDCEHEFYYEKRSEAVKDFKELIKMLSQTIETSREYLKDIEKTIKDREIVIYKIADKIDTFYISLCFGNQELHFSLIKTEKIETGKGFYFEDEEVDGDFDGVQNLDYYNWEALDKLNDIN